MIAALSPAAAGATGSDLASYVNPLIGTFPPGFVNPGPVVPFGMVGLGPDTEGPVNYGGYSYQNSLITGFSHTHMSAGVFYGGQIPFMPVAGPVRLEDPLFSRTGDAPKTPAYASPFNHASETSEPGYYRVLLERYGIGAELTATTHAGMHRYSFPPGAPASIVIDASRDLKAYRQASVSIVDDHTVTGSVSPGNPDGGFTIYFAARFDKPFTPNVFSGDTIRPGTDVQGTRVGAVLDFGPGAGTVQTKVGISYVDKDGALANLDEEIPGWDFDEVRSQARTSWNKALGRIEVAGGTPAEMTSFYTALYHAQLFPNIFSDVDGRYMGMDGVVHTTTRPQYSQFSLWDSYRGQNQLLSVIDPDAYRDMVASLMNDYRERGSLPRWVLANRRPDHMSGDPVIPFIGEAWCRGLVDDSDQAEVFRAMRELTEARPDYIRLGYNPTKKPANVVEVVEGGSGSAGTSLEFGIAEFSLALMADSSGYDADRDELVTRADNYRNLLDPETKWIRPRHDDGTWLKDFLPENGYGFQEGTSWQYSWLVMHDLAGLIEGMGGNEVVNQRLDTFFSFPATATVPVVPAKAQNEATIFGIEYRGNQYAPGNEHDLEAPFVYNYAGSPWKTQAVARGAASLYTPTPDGLPGNDDLGALSGWLVWTMLGVYPITPGTPLYTIASPIFEQATIHRPGTEDLVIESPESSSVNKYVQSATLDGAPLGSTWFTETQGRELFLDMGPLPSMTWGTQEGAAPPSLSTDPSLDSFGCVSDQAGDVKPVATTLTYVGDSQGRGTTVRLAARLVDASGAPLGARSISFTLDGMAFTATTNADGVAEVITKVSGHGRTQHVTADFGGNDAYLSSHTEADINWGRPL